VKWKELGWGTRISGAAQKPNKFNAKNSPMRSLAALVCSSFRRGASETSPVATTLSPPRWSDPNQWKKSPTTIRMNVDSRLGTVEMVSLQRWRPTTMPMRQAPAAPDFRAALPLIFGRATREGKTIKSGDLHRLVGGYPGTDHRMPICCSVMRSDMKAGDEVLAEPPKGNGATLRIPLIVGAHSTRRWAPIPRDRGRSGD